MSANVGVKQGRLINGVTTACLLTIVLFSAFNFFNFELSARSVQGHQSILTGLLSLSFLSFIIFGNKKTFISAADFWWVALILYTALSFFCSYHDAFVLNGALSYLVLYLVFKAFESRNWNDPKTRKTIQIASLASIVFLLIVQIFFILNFGLLGKDPQFNTSELHIVPCLASIIILPYFIFSDANHTRYLAPILLFVNLIAALVLNMTQAAIVILLLIIVYALFKVKYIQLIKYFVLLGFVLIIGGSLYFSIDINSANTELNINNPATFKTSTYAQNFSTCWEQFKTSPIVGHGKNTVSLYSGESNLNKLNYFFPNNSVLVLLVELGLIGLIFFAYIGVIPILRLFNERFVLSKIELAAVVSVTLFFFLSLFYGETVTQPHYFSGFPLLAVVGLAIVSKKANKSTKLAESKSNGYNIALLTASICCLIYFLS